MNLHQEEDVVPTARIALALLATIGLTVVCLVWVWLVMKPGEPVIHKAPPPSAAPTGVDATLYTRGAGYSSERTADKRAALTTWGWVDEKAGVIHMPVARAMELVVAEDAR